MYRHLVAVEVGVERAADERMQFDGAPFDEDGLERLNGKSVQRRRTVEHDGVVFDDLLQHVPDHGLCAFHRSLGVFDVVADVLFHPLFHHERLEELDGHFLRQTALIEFQFRSYDDNRTSGIVHALAEEVLSETSLLAAEQARNGLQIAVACAADGLAAAAVIDERVHSLLQHPLFVSDDDFGCAEFHQFFQAVVAVDHAPV